jgi:hypothetical protein
MFGYIVIMSERIKRLSAQDIMDRQDTGETLYVRWSRGPRYDNQPSRDYVSGGVHIGMSSVRLGNWDHEYMIRRLGEYRFLQLKDARIAPYIYLGTEVGMDSDGYELIDVPTAECIGRWSEK